MDQMKLAMIVMAATDSQWGPRDAQGRRRVFTADELDALADFGWHLPDIRGYVTGCLNAVLGRRQSAPQPRRGNTQLAPAGSR